MRTTAAFRPQDARTEAPQKTTDKSNRLGLSRLPAGPCRGHGRSMMIPVREPPGWRRPEPPNSMERCLPQRLRPTILLFRLAAGLGLFSLACHSSAAELRPEARPFGKFDPETGLGVTGVAMMQQSDELETGRLAREEPPAPAVRRAPTTKATLPAATGVGNEAAARRTLPGGEAAPMLVACSPSTPTRSATPAAAP